MKCMVVQFLSLLTYACCVANALKAGERVPSNGDYSGGLVYVIRHGEKTWQHGCLSDRGQARAENLVNVFTGQPLPAVNNDVLFPPKKIFAHAYNVPLHMPGTPWKNCERTNQTVMPLAKALGLPIDWTHGGERPGPGGYRGDGNAGAALAIKEALKRTGGPVLAAWERSNIEWLTRELGIARAPRWDPNEFGFVYVFEFDADMSLSTFRVTDQGFL